MISPEELSIEILKSLQKAFEDKKISYTLIPKVIKIERPKNRNYGDWSTNVAMQLSSKVGMPSIELATFLQKYIAKISGVDSVNIAFPGFINISVSKMLSGLIIKKIVSEGNNFGNNDFLKNLKINLEFVSANPTGPIHLGGVRWAAVGDSLARLFESQGASVDREYYVNDYGKQISIFAESLYALALNKEVPKNGYQGQYIELIAKEILENNASILKLKKIDILKFFKKKGIELILVNIKNSMKSFKVTFKQYFHESTLYKDGTVYKTIEKLKNNKHIFEKDGLLWLNTQQYGDDKNRPVLKSDGKPAYIAGDIGYMQNKFNRNYDICIYMLGADHHGYVKRLYAISQILGIQNHRVEIMIGQMVNLFENGKPYRMSKRSGMFITLEDLIEIIGVDAARYELARYPISSPIDINLDLLKKKSNDNPVFYVQYAHARTHQAEKNAYDSGVNMTTFNSLLLNTKYEESLIATLSIYKSVLKTSTELREPHRVARYLEKLAGEYHRWYDACRITPKGDEKITDINRARLWLNKAVQIVIKHGLNILGVSAPKKM